MKNYYLTVYNDEGLSVGFTDILLEQNGELVCLLYGDEDVFDEFDWDENDDRINSVEKIHRLGIEEGHNYFNDEYYNPDLPLHSNDMVIRHEDNQLYEINLFIGATGSIYASPILKAFTVKAEVGTHYVKELDSYIIVEELDAY